MGLTPAFSTPAVCSRIFHPCNYARVAFATPAFSVASPEEQSCDGLKRDGSEKITKKCKFRAINRHISETIEDRHSVTVVDYNNA